MKLFLRSLVFALFVGLVLLATVSRTAVAATPPPTQAETEVYDALHAGCRAYLRGDAVAVAAFLAPGYTLTDSAGKVTTREEDLAEVRAGKTTYTVFENRNMQARIYGSDTAVVTGQTHIKGGSEGQAFSVVFQFTDTLIRREGRWLIAASHVSRLVAK